MEGRRPLLAEVQALVTPTGAERPRRTTSGLDSSRVAMISAVLQQHCRLQLHSRDVFASTVGGARLTDPAADLAIAVALASAHLGAPPPQGVVAMGEVGLAGELRRVRDLPQRVAEAARLGFGVALVPGSRSGGPQICEAQSSDAQSSDAQSSDAQSSEAWTVDGMRVLEVCDLPSTLRLLRLTTERRGPLRPLD
jgi:DNA repair protein RadA/Sms